ncbi:aminodeoxychorismate synthase component I [Oceaniserpentilla sp. 4NH20-0058]
MVALESSNTEHDNGRWSIIAANPKEIIEIKDSLSIPQAINQLHTLSQELPNHSSKLPFTGGLIGHISYDFGIPNSNKLKLKQYKVLPTLLVGLYTWSFVIDHKEECSYLTYWSDDTNSEAELKTKFIQCLKEHKQQKESDFKIHAAFQPHWDKPTYKQKIESIKDYIVNGDIYQANLAQHFSASYSGNPINAYSALKESANVPFATYFESDNWSFASASPELFIQYENGVATTKPIKGTLPRLPNPEDDNLQKLRLSSSPKDMAENLMIVDLLRNDLSKHGSNICVSKLFDIETFSTVHHLVSTITSNVNRRDIIKLLLDAFPGGSITGAPKQRAMEIISELECFPRSFYCGSTFYLSSNHKFNSNILIRSFLFEDSKVTCWAGGGIVHDSQWESEYQESLDKITKLMECLTKV